jgi:osmotically inducible lipoprotein OsmB
MLALTLLVAATLALAACSTWRGLSDAEKGTAIGAGVGGVAGAAATDGSVLGTVGGAAVGGAIGHEVGKRRDDD